MPKNGTAARGIVALDPPSNVGASKLSPTAVPKGSNKSPATGQEVGNNFVVWNITCFLTWRVCGGSSGGSSGR